MPGRPATTAGKITMTSAFVEKLRRLSDLTDADLEQIAGICEPAAPVSAHTDIVKEGEHNEVLHLVLDGWACRYRLLADGRRQFTALLLPGDTCDLDRLLMDRLEFGVAALTPCKVARLPLDKLRLLLDQNPAIRRVFWWLTFVENAVASEWAVCLGRRSAVERLAHLICELKVRLSAIGAVQDDSYALPLTQEELADALGLSVVHVNRTMQSLRQERLISLEGRRLTIMNWEALNRMCDFKPSYLHLEGLRRKELHGH